RRNACAARSVENRQVKQFFSSRSRLSVFEACSNLQQQVLRVRDNFFNAGIRAVSLVNRNNHRKLCLKCLGQHEAGLRKRAFRGIDKQHDAINHGQPALDLATEVSVTRGVNNIDDQVSAVFTLALAVNRSVLGQGKDGADLIINVIDTPGQDRKSTRLNSSHVSISYAGFCLNKKKT